MKFFRKRRRRSAEKRIPPRKTAVRSDRVRVALDLRQLEPRPTEEFFCEMMARAVRSFELELR